MVITFFIIISSIITIFLFFLYTNHFIKLLIFLNLQVYNFNHFQLNGLCHNLKFYTIFIVISFFIIIFSKITIFLYTNLFKKLLSLLNLQVYNFYHFWLNSLRQNLKFSSIFIVISFFFIISSIITIFFIYQSL